MRNATHLGTFTGHNYVPPEPAVSLPQAILAGLCIALFVCGGLAMIWGATL
jgi:hypothetical protein